MQAIVQIAKPCGEDWNAMQPVDGGKRHCDSCCHAVVDFTNWEPDAIVTYLKARQGEKICGRFNSAHVVTPKIEVTAEEVVKYVSFAPISWIQKVAAIILISIGVTLASCGTGDQPNKNVRIVGALTLDANIPEPVLQSADTPRTTPKPVAEPQPTLGEAVMDPPVKGDVALIPDTPVVPEPMQEPPPVTTGGAVLFVEPEPQPDTLKHPTMGKPCLPKHDTRDH